MAGSAIRSRRRARKMATGNDFRASTRDGARRLCLAHGPSKGSRRGEAASAGTGGAIESDLFPLGGATVGRDRADRRSRTSCVRHWLGRRSREVVEMKFWLGFILGAYCVGNRVSRILFVLWILFLTFCLYEMSKPLGYR